MKFTAYITCLLSLVFICSCQTPIDEVLLQPIDKDIQMGMVIKEQVRADIGLLELAPQNLYLEKLGEKLTSALPERRFNYEFHLIDQEAPNAFAAPGGYVFVSRGLLALCLSEDELAQVVAHEINHIKRRHGARQQARSLLPGLLSLPGRIIGSITPRIGSLINLPVHSIGGSYIAAFSRAHENEADKLGQDLATGITGYRPQAMGDILQRIEKYNKITAEVETKFSFFNTHPLTPARVKALANHGRDIESIPLRKPISTSKEFRQILDGLTLGSNPAKGFIRSNSFLHPKLNFYLSAPEKWRTINAPESLFFIAPNETGIFVLQIADEGDKALEKSKKLRNIIEEELKLHPTKIKTQSINSKKAHGLHYQLENDTTLNAFFIAHEGLTYMLLSLCDKQVAPSAQKTIDSFRSLTKEEKQSITVNRLRLRQARANETLKQFTKRTGNNWSLAMTALMNNISEDKPLAENQMLKISLEEVFSTKK